MPTFNTVIDDYLCMSTTDTEDTRWKFTNDVGFWSVILIYFLVWAYLHIEGRTVFWLMDLTVSVAFLTAVIWAFGQQAAAVASEVLSDGPPE